MARYSYTISATPKDAAYPVYTEVVSTWQKAVGIARQWSTDEDTKDMLIFVEVFRKDDGQRMYRNPDGNVSFTGISWR